MTDYKHTKASPGQKHISSTQFNEMGSALEENVKIDFSKKDFNVVVTGRNRVTVSSNSSGTLTLTLVSSEGTVLETHEVPELIFIDDYIEFVKTSETRVVVKIKPFPNGGQIYQVLQKASGEDNDVCWDWLRAHE